MSYVINPQYPVLKTGNIVTSPYGMRTDPFTKDQAMHRGIDIVKKGIVSDAVIAIESGIVITTRTYVTGKTIGKTECGNYVLVDHGNGYVSQYNHLAHGSVLVKVGDKVERGQQLAMSGTTGRSTGIHLHFGILLNGDYVDPEPYLLGAKKIKESVLSPTSGKGDIDGDGDIDSKDYLMAKRAVLGTLELTEEQMDAADVNGDGKITALDYLIIKRVAQGTYKIK